MFLPIIIDPFHFDHLRYKWVYLKFLYHCFHSNWPMIVQERYKSQNIGYWQEFRNQHQFELLESEQLQQTEVYFISETVFQEHEKLKGSKLASKIALLNESFDVLEKVLDEYILKIKENHPDEPIEGIINWAAHSKSVKRVAAKYNIPVITEEFCLRFPNYRSTGYVCFGDIYQSEEIKRRYESFLKSKEDFPYELFSNEELLAISLEDETKEYLRMYHAKPQYEIGIGGCHPLVTTFFAKSMYTDLELIQDVLQEYSQNDVLFRKHPGDEPYEAYYQMKNQDKSASPIEFILKCRRIAAQGSNIIPEAMLWNRMVYTHDVSPFAQFCETDYTNHNATRANRELLNFIFFSYIVPLELMWNEDYLRWRVSFPDEMDIFKYHFNYYMKERGITSDILNKKIPSRLKELMRNRGI